jgi:hypothetical protein
VHARPPAHPLPSVACYDERAREELWRAWYAGASSAANRRRGVLGCLKPEPKPYEREAVRDN